MVLANQNQPNARHIVLVERRSFVSGNESGIPALDVAACVAVCVAMCCGVCRSVCRTSYLLSNVAFLRGANLEYLHFMLHVAVQVAVCIALCVAVCVVVCVAHRTC